MKSGKKISLFILLILLNISVVKAESTCDMIFEAKDGSYYNELDATIGDIRSSIFSFYEKDTTNKYTAYCMNPGWSTGKKNEEKTAEYSCKRIALDVTSDSENQKRHDKGLAKILIPQKKAYGQAERNLAVRIYEMYWKTFNKNGNNSSLDYKSHKKIANDWLKDADVKKALANLKSKLPQGYIVEKEFPDAADEPAIEGLSLADAKELLIEGLNEAFNYDPKTDTKINYDNPQKTREILAEDKNGVKTYKQSETYTINIENFTSGKDSDGNEYSEIKLNFECAECAKKGISYKFFINDVEVKNLNSTNLLDLKENNTLKTENNLVSGKVKFKIEFTGKVSTCEDIDYVVTINYKDPNVDKEIYEVKASNYSNTNGVQSFYIVADKKTEAKAVIDTKLSFCTNSSSTTSSGCSTNITNLQCNHCEDNNNVLKIEEGYSNANPKSCTQGTTLDIKTCIAKDEAKDKAGNSYKSYELEGDLYCGLYCKEDYIITLPGTKIVSSGRYFTLSANLQGTKTCYANGTNGGPIGYRIVDGKEVSFEDDITNAAKKSVEAYNNYLKAYGKAHNIKSAKFIYGDGEDEWCTKPTNGTNGYEKCYDEYHEGLHAGTSPNYGKWCEWIPATPATSGDKKIIGIDYTYTYTEYSYSGTPTEGIEDHYRKDFDTPICESQASDDLLDTKLSDEESEEITGKFPEYGPGDINTPDGKPTLGTVNIPIIEEGSGPALGVGSYGIWNYAYQLNVCSNTSTKINQTKNGQSSVFSNITQLDWPSYPLGQNDELKLNFWYQEREYINMAKYKNLDMSLVSTNNDDEYEMLYCAGEVSADYKLCDESETKWQKEVPLKKLNVFACPDQNGCRTFNIEYSAAKYVKKVMKKSAEFTTPTQFYTIYPSGQIVVKTKEDAEIPNSSPLKNKWPVGLGTKPGYYTYLLMFEGLGEHYNTGKLGRIWGDSTSVVSKTLQEEATCRKDSALKENVEVGKDVFNGGVYACEYDVNVCPNPPEEKVEDPDKYTCEKPEKDSKGNITAYYNDEGHKLADKKAWIDACCKAHPDLDGMPDPCPQQVDSDKYTCEKPEKDSKGNVITYYDDKSNKLADKKAWIDACCEAHPDLDGMPDPCPSDDKPTCENPKTSTDEAGNTIYAYCDYLPKGSSNATYTCKEDKTKTEYNKDCNPTKTKPVCTTSPISPSDYFANKKYQSYKGEVKYYIDGKETDLSTFKEKCCVYDENTKDKYWIGQMSVSWEIYNDFCKCPDCPVVCDGEKCGKNEDGTPKCCYKDCPPTGCPTVCKNCVIDNLNYRPVSPDSLNPNDRTLGANWSYDKNIDSALELKAYVTTSEIEEAGSKIYDTDGPTNKVTFTLNREMITYIRNYNKKQDESGKGYYNNSLECYSYYDRENNVEYKNVYCYSTFIDELVNNYSSQIKGFTNRLMTNRDKGTQDSTYWTTWAESRDNVKNWLLTTEVGIENIEGYYSYFSDFEKIKIGPAWK